MRTQNAPLIRVLTQSLVFNSYGLKKLFIDAKLDASG
jgi:hypothetical protein